MKTNFKSLAMAAVALLAMSACSNEWDEQLNAGEGQPLNFNLSIQNGATTKTSTNPSDRVTSWSKGDAVGLFVYEKGAIVGTAQPVHTNIKLTFDGSKWSSAEPIFSEAEYDFYAYYPYQAAASNPTKIAVKAQANQSKEADYNLSDIMAAPKATAAADAETVALTFKHVFSLVEVQVHGDLVTAAPASVVLKNVKTDASLNLANATATAAGTAGDVTLQALDAQQGTYAYRAVVPAQTIKANTHLVQVQNADKHYAMKYSTDVAYEAGKYRSLSVFIGKTKVELTIPTPGITPWEPSKPGTGQGGTEEIVPPVKPVTLLTDFGVAEGLTFQQGGKYASNNLVATGKGWFTRFGDESGKTKAEAVASTFTTVAGQTKALKITLDGAAVNGWNNNSICYRVAQPFEQGKYKLTFAVKPSVSGKSIGGGVMIRTAGDDQIMTVEIDETKVKGISTFTISAEKEISATFDFTQKTTKASSGAITDPSLIKATTAEDVKAINIYFYNNTKGSSLEIIPVKLEKVTATVK